MSKTNFVNGSYLTPAYMNTIYGSGPTSGHRHDGVDADGHALKIDLTQDVAGALPAANGGITTPTTGTFVGRLHQNPGWTVPVDHTFSYQLEFPSGRCTLSWPDLDKDAAVYKPSDWLYLDATSGGAAAHPMPLKCHPMTGPDLIVGTAMCLKTETETTPPTDSAAATNVCMVQVPTLAATGSIKFIKDRGQDWMVTGTDSTNTILAGQVSYITGYTF